MIARIGAAVVLAAWTAPAGGAEVRFVDVAADSGVDLVNVAGEAAREYIIQSTGNGAGWVDYDGDGDLDLLVTHGSTLARMYEPIDPLLALYRNDGGSFREVAAASGLDGFGWANGLCAADWDNDGDQDVYLTAHGANRFFVNDGRGRFEERADAYGLGDSRWSTSCAWADYDGDGWLDLYVANYVVFEADRLPPRGCNYMGHASFCGPLGMTGERDALWRNVEGRGFADATVEAGLVAPGRYGMAVSFADLDGDRYPDLFVANDSQPNYLFRNRGDGTFEERGLLSGVAVSGRAEAQAAMGVAIGDVDHDADLDLLITNFSQDHNTLYRNEGSGVFSDVTFLAGVGGQSLPYLAWGTSFADFDNDGRLDLFVSNGHIYEDVESFGIGSTWAQPNQLFLNRGDGRFDEVTSNAGPGFALALSSRGSAVGDYDGDGDLDLAVVNMDHRPSLLRNDSIGGNSLRLRLVGRAPADAVGAVIALTAEGEIQTASLLAGDSFQSMSERRVHFGIGRRERVDRLSIRWPGGARRSLVTPPGGRLLVVPEGASTARH